MAAQTQKNRGEKTHLRGLEQLEERIAPAGGITAVVRGGNLMITGDDFDNDIVIEGTGFAGAMRISSGPDATLIIVGVIAQFICALFSSYVAEQKGRDPTAWFFAALLGGIFALIAVAAVPPEWEMRPGEDEDAEDGEDEEVDAGEIVGP